MSAPSGVALRVSAVEAGSAASLLSEGIGPGVEVSVERKLALGGPVIVRLGGARLALARSIAATVQVEGVDNAHGPAPG